MRVENKKARFEYEVVETFEAGLILTGPEVKSIKAGQVNLTGARVIEKEGKLFVVGMSVPKYQFATDPEYDPGRIRELLFHKKEITSILSKKEARGLTLVALSAYNKGDLIKLEIALVRGKKKYEKREQVKKRDEELALARRLKK
ncbi:SsrA-binding protein SmpB [Candidatus Collierbacteria bacterium]|nr:SsrA-binding protein SmpB [Candidatus Collierbacteria bacterium]